ncbi:DUF6962 family protein [Marinoscillum furvescens]|nr:hypothetical protein [Marinoscillum furvescens]
MNWVLATQCFIFFLRLRGTENKFQKYWSWFFLAYTISLIFGGFSHLLYNYTGMLGKIPGWSVAAIGIVAAESAMLLDVQDPKKRQMLLTVVRSKLFATFMLLIIDLSFKWVMVHTAGFFLLAGLLSWSRFKEGQTNYKYFLYGMAGLFVMAGVKVGQVDIHPAWFNRDDIAHVIMLGMYYLFFLGVKGYGTSPKSAQATIE